jgi:hypothetical protein
MKWNAAIRIGYNLPIAGREAKAMEVFADAFTTFGKLAADGRCAEPEAFHHLVGGGFMLIKTESVVTAHEILDSEEVRHLIDTALFTVSDMDLEIMTTGEQLMVDMALYAAIGTELTYI